MVVENNQQQSQPPGSKTFGANKTKGNQEDEVDVLCNISFVENGRKRKSTKSMEENFMSNGIPGDKNCAPEPPGYSSCSMDNEKCERRKIILKLIRGYLLYFVPKLGPL